MNELYIGMMSGTSMDAIDAVLVSFSGPHPTILASYSLPLESSLRERLSRLATPDVNELNQMMELDVLMGRQFANASLTLVQQSGVSASAIQAIGSHGQTVRHIPNGNCPTTLQIGDPNIIAEISGITTVADFRRRDMAAGGQGAPLVPAFHAAILRSSDHPRVVVNIGGMANISVLMSDENGAVTGFDTGPGNVLMDSWTQRHTDKAWDEKGQWAAQGKIDEVLLQKLLAEPYFHQAPPKSTGREQFNDVWLTAQLDRDIPAEDVQSTLCELTARSITMAVNAQAPGCKELLVCGGGAYNDYLMQRLAANLPSITVDSTARYGIEPRWMEAMAFAWLARQTMMNLPGNLPAVTGAKHPVILGGIYPAPLQNQ